jgi:mRNA interferase MazF
VLDADVILALITTRQVVADSRVELLLQPSDPEFARTNLNSASVIRMHKLVTLDRRLVRGRIGRVGPQTMQRVKESLRFVLEL